MTRVLGAWLEGQYVGDFTDDGRAISFTYDTGAPDVPVSLSIPRHGTATRNAAGLFLDNLLPDRERARQWMASVTGADSTSTFDLLDKVGGDVAGGLVLLPEGSEPGDHEAQFDPAFDDSIAFRIRSLKNDPDEWLEKAEPARFSLAGSQAKFALARVGEDWYWSNAGLPSTHIIKPGAKAHDEIEVAESAAVTLAASLGIPAPTAGVLEVEGERAYIVERFDRDLSNEIPTRIHAEDLEQAMGRPSGDKYHTTAQQVVELLRKADATDGLGYDFVRQLAFNTAIGNADAHAKNYSILLRPDGVSLSPIYDAVPTKLWPGYDETLAMEIAGAAHAQEVTSNHWAKFAAKAGLDADRVVGVAEQVYQGIAEHAYSAWEDLSDSKRAAMAELTQKHTRQVLGGKRSPASGGVSSSGAQR